MPMKLATKPSLNFFYLLISATRADMNAYKMPPITSLTHERQEKQQQSKQVEPTGN